jgi:hypothetical protein
MVATQTLIIGAAALAFLIPERTAAAGGAAGEFGVGIARGITALGTIKISPEFAPNISPRVVPEFGIKTDFPDWLDPREIWGLEKIFKGDDPEVVEVEPAVVVPPVVVPPVVVPPVVVEEDPEIYTGP